MNANWGLISINHYACSEISLLFAHLKLIGALFWLKISSDSSGFVGKVGGVLFILQIQLDSIPTKTHFDLAKRAANLLNSPFTLNILIIFVNAA